VDLLRFYLSFPIHDHTGDPLSEEDVTAAHYDRVQQLQRLFFKHVPKLQELALANCATGGCGCGGCGVVCGVWDGVDLNPWPSWGSQHW